MLFDALEVYVYSVLLQMCVLFIVRNPLFNLRKKKVTRKHSLHGKKNSLGFIDKRCHAIDAP